MCGIRAIVTYLYTDYSLYIYYLNYFYIRYHKRVYVVLHTQTIKMRIENIFFLYESTISYVY